jgi:hypothetical protein
MHGPYNIKYVKMSCGYVTLNIMYSTYPLPCIHVSCVGMWHSLKRVLHALHISPTKKVAELLSPHICSGHLPWTCLRLDGCSWRISYRKKEQCWRNQSRQCVLHEQKLPLGPYSYSAPILKSNHIYRTSFFHAENVNIRCLHTHNNTLQVMACRSILAKNMSTAHYP